MARLPRRLTTGFSRSSVASASFVALQEEHGDLDVVEMLGAFVAGLAGGVKREGEEDQAAHVGQRASSACACEVMRPPNDLPPAKSGSFGASSCCFRDSGADGAVRERRRIGAL